MPESWKAEKKIEDLRKAIDEQNDDQIKTRMEALEKTMQEIATEAYQAAGGDAVAGAAGAGAPPPSDDEGGDGVIDAEFEDAN